MWRPVRVAMRKINNIKFKILLDYLEFLDKIRKRRKLI